MKQKEYTLPELQEKYNTAMENGDNLKREIIINLMEKIKEKTKGQLN